MVGGGRGGVGADWRPGFCQSAGAAVAAHVAHHHQCATAV